MSLFLSLSGSATAQRSDHDALVFGIAHECFADLVQNDLILLITFSGSTPELHTLLPHLPSTCPRVILTSHTSAATCSLTNELSSSPGEGTIILPAPIPESETASFGIPAPTTSTTVALALGDALAIATAGYLHEGLEGRESRGVFARNHPGGALGKVLAPIAAKMV